MEGDPDAKRPRRDLELAAYPSSVPPLLRPATAPTPNAQPQQYSEPPQSAPPVHPYPPPGSRPPSTHHSGHPGASHYRRESASDPRNRLPYKPTANQQPTHQEPPPGYGMSQPQPRPSYPLEPTPSRPPSVPNQPAGITQQREPLRPESHERRSSSSMEHAPHHGYPPMDPHGNSAIPNGLPYSSQQEQYAVGPVGHPGYPPPTPVTSYAQPSAYSASGPTHYGSVAKRKQVRATQACNNCRQRKQKCDEARPCGYCKIEGLDCEYREVPPPKTDRTMRELLEKQQGTAERIDQTAEAIEQNTSRLHNLEGMVGQIMNILTQQGRHPDVRKESGFNTGIVQQYQPPRSTPIAMSHQVSVDSAEDTIAGALKQEEPPEPEVDQAVPEHETGAHHLIVWPHIKDYFRGAEILSRGYVQEEEERQGTIMPYGSVTVYGDGYSSVESTTSPNQSAYSDQASASSPVERKFGSGFEPSDDPSKESIGGLNPDGTLKLDHSTVWKLYESYMRHMWVLHPFLNVSWLEDKIHQFIADYSPKPMPFVVPTAPASRAGIDTYSGISGQKRKRQSGVSDQHSQPGTPDAMQWERLRPPKVEKSVTNAVILLVLALGKVLESDYFLLQERERSSVETSGLHNYHSSPPGIARPSPPQYHTGFRHTQSSNFEPIRSGIPSRGSSTERSGIHEVRNVDRYPGLAYLAYATGILGNNIGGNDVIHAQGYLLAGLYYGQLGRALESWAWINTGCRATVMLPAKKGLLSNPNITESVKSKPKLDEGQDDELQLMSILCWSSLQLESDVRAELDKLPKASELMYQESRIMTPSRLTGLKKYADGVIKFPSGGILQTNDIVFHYTMQLYLRMALNRIHISLYAPTTASGQDTRQRNTIYAHTTADQHFWYLQTIRQSIHARLPWDDKDRPSDDLIVARMRGKYYGARYIILRPYLYTALRWEWDRNHNKAFWSDRLSLQQFTQPQAFPDQEAPLEVVQSDVQLANEFLWCCKSCIESAALSTVAFDGVADPRLSRRARVTNIHGTATAQFSNMLVLVSAYKSWLRPLVPYEKLYDQIERTILLHKKLSPLSKVFEQNHKVLEEARADLVETHRKEEPKAQMAQIAWHTGSQGSPASMHSTNSLNSMASPAQYFSPSGPTSAHTSFVG